MIQVKRRSAFPRLCDYGIKSELLANSTTTPRDRNFFTRASSTGIFVRKGPRVELTPLINLRSSIRILATCP